MSTLVADTLKQRGDGDFPIAFAEDVHVDYDDTDLETALQPATDSTLGTVKIGENMDIDADGTLSIVNRVEIDDDKPTDGSLTWVDTARDTPSQQIIKVSAEAKNAITMQDDGIFGYNWHTTRPEPLWAYQIDGVLYYKGWPIGLTKTITVYIDASGSDVTGDGTQENPRKTFSGIPRDFSGYGVNVYISGDYFSLQQDMTIGGFRNGYMNIYMVDTPNFWRFQLYNNEARIYIREGFTASISGYPTSLQTGWAYAVYIGGCSTVYFTSSNTTTKGTSITVTSNGTAAFTSITTGLTTCHYRGVVIEGANVYCDSRILFTIQKAYQGLVALGGSRAHIDQLTVKNCSYGLVAGFSKFSCGTYTSTSNTNQYSIYSGGRYYTGAQSSVGSY